MPRLSDERIAEIRKVVSKGWSIEIVPTSDLTLLLDEVAERRKVVVIGTMDAEDKSLHPYWTIWYRCPPCQQLAITPDMHYCPHCGVKIRWRD